MIDIKKAKVKFLSLAFKGALVDYPNKEKSNEALNAIHSKQKGFAPVETEEFLIVAPSYWNWSRLGYITKNHGQIVPDTDFCYIDVGTLDNVHQRLAEKENLANAKDAPSRARKIVQFGDVLYSTVRPYLHNICVIDKNFSRTPIASTAFCVMQANESVLLNKYLFYWLLTSEFDKYSNGDPSKGALYPAIGEKDLLRGVIPLPSVDEQRLIVEKIEQAFSVLDTIDELQAQYADNLTVLKSKLIDLAIRGKLSEQLPEDGTVEELYQKIQEEKQALIKSGKIKKEKPLPEIAEDEMPFEIPENWKWVRFGDILRVLSGVSYEKSDVSTSGLRILRGGNIQEMKVVYDTSDVFLPLFYKEEEKTIHKGDIVIVASTGSEAVIGKPGYVIEDDNDTMVGAFLRICRPNSIELSQFIRILFMSEYYRQHIRQEAKGTNINNVKENHITHLLVPLPPLAEQKRIVDRLDQILAVCDELK